MTGCLLDTGPLVTLLDRSEPEHARVRSFLSHWQEQRLITTGAVITEAFYFLSDVRHGPAKLVSFLEESGIEVRDAFTPAALTAAARLMAKYADTPMDFSDATLVWLAEQTGIDDVLTLDRRGFLTYRFGRSRRFTLVLEA
jgi:predicted nucleic acid-binding protein